MILHSLVLIVIEHSVVHCKFDTIIKEDGENFKHVLVSDTDNDLTTTNVVSGIKNDVIAEPVKRNLRLGDDIRRNLTFDVGGNPLVTVDPQEIDAQNSLLMEHDERFHYDLPGHTTIMPQIRPKNAPVDDNDGVESRDNSKNCDTPSLNSGKLSSARPKQLDIEMRPSRGHFELDSSQVDLSLSGKVDLRDEDDLMQMVVDKPPKFVRHRRAFFNPAGKSHLWPNGEYVYVFDHNTEPTPKSLLLRAFKEIGDRVPCVKFSPADGNSERYIIHTSHNTAQCYADTIGYMPDIQALVNIGSYCDYGVVMHEVFHVLGAIHTHNRPDRDEFVAINWDNIDPAQVHNFNRRTGSVHPSDSEYDYKSAMHYPANAFNYKNNNDSTVRPLDNSIKLKDYGHYVLDDQDYESLKTWYGCGSSNSPPETNSHRTVIDESSNLNINTSRGQTWHSDCVVGPWSEWSACENGYKTKQRYIEMPKNSDGLSCPNKKKQIRCRSKRRHSRSTDSDPSKVEVEEFDENRGKAVTHMKKLVKVVEGKPIVLMVGNPRNFPVKWYQVIEGQDQELSSGDYNMFRTSAGNNRLTLDHSSVEENDGQLFVTKISMKNSILRVAWNVEILSEDEYFGNSRTED